MTTTPNDLIHSFQATDRFDGNYSGLTKREYFALCIYAGLMSSTFIHTEYVTVKDAVERADSLIEELNKIAEDITQPEEWIPVRGEKVLVKVKGRDEWHERIYLMTMKEARYPILVVWEPDEDRFLNNEPYLTDIYEQVKQLPQMKH